MAEPRSQEEIVARIKGYQAAPMADFFGFRTEVLIAALHKPHARQFLKEGAKILEDWPDPEDAQERAAGYLEFAIEKIRNHRGVSAVRSVQKLGEYAWLLRRDDVVDSMEAAPYENYGAPQVKCFALMLGLRWPGDEALNRMAHGEPCRPGCEEGCGRGGA